MNVFKFGGFRFERGFTGPSGKDLAVFSLAWMAGMLKQNYWVQTDRGEAGPLFS